MQKGELASLSEKSGLNQLSPTESAQVCNLYLLKYIQTCHMA
jgi:hypothetical protein